MTIRQLVEDTVFLAEGGRYLGALATVLAAVSGSSRKVFPRGVARSFIHPKDVMRDKEAFTRFLGRRLCEIMTQTRFPTPDATGTLVAVEIGGQTHSIESILYEQFRCSIAHDGMLPATVAFDEKHGFRADEMSIHFSVADGVVRLEQGWLGLLVRVVSHAPCNGEEFGIAHYRLEPKQGIDVEAFNRKLIADFDISPGRVGLLERLVEFASPEAVERSSLIELNGILAPELRGGLVTGLASKGLATYGGELTAPGVNALKRVAQAYSLVRL